MNKESIFLSESVTEGHPDKLCDQISDAVVDEVLRDDPLSRVITESAVSSSVIFISSMFDAGVNIDVPQIAREVLERIGYTHPDFNPSTCSIVTNLQTLKHETWSRFDERHMNDREIDTIAVREMANQFGFACNHTPALMPLPIWLAHKLARRLDRVRHEKRLAYLNPDGKVQVGIAYKKRKPHRIHSITVITSHGEAISRPRLYDEIVETVIRPVFEDEPIKPDAQTHIHINPFLPLALGGPAIHAGLTGRKNAIDTYGEYARHSGAALSGKGPTRIDRVGAYAARHAAKNIVAAGLAEECEVRLTYSIGESRPAGIQVDTFDTGIISDNKIADLVREHFDFRLAAIMNRFGLRHQSAHHKKGFYARLAVYGQVGREDMKLPWEALDLVDALKQ